MEIARLEVSTQKHLDQMQETVKVNYMQYGKGSKARNANPRPVATVAVVAAVLVLKNATAAMPVLVKPNPKARNPHYLWTSARGAEKQDTRKVRSARHLRLCAGIAESKGTTKKCA